MKKGLEKFLSIALLTLGGILIILFLLAVFGTIGTATLQNQVVRAMSAGLSFVFLVCAIVMVVASFKDNEVLKAIILSADRTSTTRVSLSVIRKVVAQNASHINGLKVTGMALVLDENNAIRMKLTVKISDNDVDFVVDRFRCLLFDAFYEVLGVEFSSIDFKVKALSPKYAPDMNKIDRAALEIKEKREKLMLQKLKMEEEEAQFEEQRKLSAENRRKEEVRLKREREEARRKERQQMIDEENRRNDFADGAEEVPVYFVSDDFSMPSEIAEDKSISAEDVASTVAPSGSASQEDVAGLRDKLDTEEPISVLPEIEENSASEASTVENVDTSGCLENIEDQKNLEKQENLENIEISEVLESLKKQKGEEASVQQDNTAKKQKGEEDSVQQDNTAEGAEDNLEPSATPKAIEDGAEPVEPLVAEVAEQNAIDTQNNVVAEPTNTNPAGE